MGTGVESSFQPKFYPKFQRVSTWALEVPECALGAGVSAKAQVVSTCALEVLARSRGNLSVGTWKREVPECDHVGAEASNCEYFCAGSLGL